MYGGYGDTSTPLFFLSYTQQPRVSTQVRPLVLHVRAASPAAALAEIRRTIASLDSTLAFEVQTLRQATGTEPALRRFGTQLLGGAGGLGLLLAAIGLYGTMAFVVATRTSEIGLRMAVGATTRTFFVACSSQGMRLVGLDSVIGAAISLALARSPSGCLPVSARDPLAFVGTAALQLVVGAAACYIPARTGSGRHPIVALAAPVTPSSQMSKMRSLDASGSTS